MVLGKRLKGMFKSITASIKDLKSEQLEAFQKTGVWCAYVCARALPHARVLNFHPIFPRPKPPAAKTQLIVVLLDAQPPPPPPPQGLSAKTDLIVRFLEVKLPGEQGV